MLLVVSACDAPPAAPPPELKPLGLLEQRGPERHQGVNAAVSVLTVTPDPHDAGTVRDRDKVSTTFHVSNPTDKPITISAMKPECACTVSTSTFEGKAVTLPFALPPGGTLDVPVVVDPSGRSDLFDTCVLVTSDQHPQRPYTWLRVRMMIVPELSLDPPFLFFGVVDKGKVHTRALVVHHRDPRFDVLRILCSHTWLTARVVSRTPPVGNVRGRIELEVILTADAPEGDLEGRIALDTTWLDEPRRELVVKALVQGEVSLSTDTVAFRHVSRGEHPARVLILRSSAIKIEVMKVTVEPSFVRWTLLPREGDAVGIRFEVGDAPEGVGDVVTGRISIETNGRERPTIEVPLHIQFSPPRR